MNFSTLLSSQSIAQSIPIGAIITAIFAVLVVFGAIKGLCRGAVRQTVRTVTIILSALIAFFLVTGITLRLSVMCEGKTVEAFLTEMNIISVLDSLEPQMRDIVSGMDAQTLKTVLLVPLSVLVYPLLFTAVFIVISAVMEIIHAIICLIFHIKKKNNTKLTRLIGMAIGAVQGLAVAIILFMPIANLLGIADEAVNSPALRDSDNTELQEFLTGYDTYAQEASDSFVIKLTQKVGGNALCSAMSAVKIEDVKYKGRDLTSHAIDIVNDIMDLTAEEIDLNSPTDEQKSKIKAIEKKITDDTYFATVFSGVLSEYSKAVGKGTVEIESEPPMDSFIAAFFEIFETSSASNVGDDMETLLDVYFILAEGEVIENLGDEEQTKAAFIRKDSDGKTVISKAISSLRTNSRTAPLTAAITELSIAIMSAELELDDDASVIYANVKDGVGSLHNIDKDSMSQTEYKTAVTESLDDTLRESGIDLPDEMVEDMADFYISEFSDAESLTEENIDDVIFSYYDAYIEYSDSNP